MRMQLSEGTIMITKGAIYEDCSYHPVLCTEIDGDDVAGISLIDGSEPRSCSIKHCAVRVMTTEEIVHALRNRNMILSGHFINTMRD